MLKEDKRCCWFLPCWEKNRHVQTGHDPQKMVFDPTTLFYVDRFRKQEESARSTSVGTPVPDAPDLAFTQGLVGPMYSTLSPFFNDHATPLDRKRRLLLLMDADGTPSSFLNKVCDDFPTLLDEVSADSELRDQLLHYVMDSKPRFWQKLEGSKAQIRASKAITLLVAAGISLDNQDFSEIQIPDAILDGALLTNARFVGAYLGGVSFRWAWLVNADFTGAYLCQVQFGLDEKKWQPSMLDEMAAISALAYSPDGRYLCSGSIDGRLSVWTIKARDTYAFLGSYQGAPDAISSLAYSVDGRNLYVGYGPYAPKKIWRVRVGGYLDTPADLIETVFAGADSSVREPFTTTLPILEAVHKENPVTGGPYYHETDDGVTSPVDSTLRNQVHYMATGHLDGTVMVWQILDHGLKLHWRSQMTTLMVQGLMLENTTLLDPELAQQLQQKGAVLVRQGLGHSERSRTSFTATHAPSCLDRQPLQQSLLSGKGTQIHRASSYTANVLDDDAESFFSRASQSLDKKDEALFSLGRASQSLSEFKLSATGDKGCCACMPRLFKKNKR